MEYVVRSKSAPYRYHTGEGWTDDPEQARKHPTEQMANATITLHKMDAEAVRVVDNPDRDQSENGGGAQTTTTGNK